MKTCVFKNNRGGFTLTEILIALGVSTAMIVALLSVYLTCLRSWHQTVLAIDTSREANHCLEQMIYGVGTGMGLRASYSATNMGSTTDWLIKSSNYNGLAWYDYDANKTIVIYSNSAGSQVIGTNIISSTLTSTVNSISISMTVLKTDGRYSGSNTMSTFVKLRTASMR